MNDLKARLEAIKAEAGLQNPERIALLARITLDAAALQARAAAGEDVSGELLHVAAQAANLDETARQIVGKHLMGLATDVLSKALGVAVVAG